MPQEAQKTQKLEENNRPKEAKKTHKLKIRKYILNGPIFCVFLSILWLKYYVPFAAKDIYEFFVLFAANSKICLCGQILTNYVI